MVSTRPQRSLGGLLVDDSYQRANAALRRIQARVAAEQDRLVDLFRQDDIRRYLALTIERWQAPAGGATCVDQLDHPRAGAVACDFTPEHLGLHHGTADGQSMWWP